MNEIDYDQLYYAYKILWEVGREIEEAENADPESPASEPEQSAEASQ